MKISPCGGLISGYVLGCITCLQVNLRRSGFYKENLKVSLDFPYKIHYHCAGAFSRKLRFSYSCEQNFISEFYD